MRLFVSLAAWYACVSLVTFLAYTADKIAAMRDARRLREDTLHLLALAGGWPGALAAQFIVRHKSAKPAFRQVFWITLLANVGVLTVVLVALRA